LIPNFKTINQGQGKLSIIVTGKHDLVSEVDKIMAISRHVHSRVLCVISCRVIDRRLNIV